ncbi:MAG: hypothetical protein SPI71_03545 [Acidaminococcaceae bacterium]|nr:hypothetical protein [Acidaminococcaceae bacterium]
MKISDDNKQVLKMAGIVTIGIFIFISVFTFVKFLTFNVFVKVDRYFHREEITETRNHIPDIHYYASNVSLKEMHIHIRFEHPMGDSNHIQTHKDEAEIKKYYEQQLFANGWKTGKFSEGKYVNEQDHEDKIENFFYHKNGYTLKLQFFYGNMFSDPFYCIYIGKTEMFLSGYEEEEGYKKIKKAREEDGGGNRQPVNKEVENTPYGTD